MRSALDENNRRMLAVLDERRQLNDAYTHDLRTPIAVLKGYTDMLCRYLPDGQMSPEEVLDTARTMSAHVARLEQFVGSMNTAQKLADVTLQCEAVPAEEFPSLLAVYIHVDALQPLAWVLTVETIPLLRSEGGAISRLLLRNGVLLVLAGAAMGGLRVNFCAWKPQFRRRRPKSCPAEADPS